jgi:uncharacterized protein YneR
MATTTTKEKESEEEAADYFQDELSSLGIECKRPNEFNYKEELQALTTAIKEVYFQDYKTAYNDTSDTEIDQSHFGHWI